jgi:hypothetical protein
VKTTFFAFALVVALSLTASAANQKPAPSQRRAGAPGEAGPYKDSPTPLVPALCQPCLFYGGDLNPSALNAVGLSDENTLLIGSGGGSTYGAVNIPVTSTVFGIVFNVQADAAFDPLTASYDIRTGVSEGNGGTSIASGSATTVVQATGRSFIGVTEYRVAVSFSPGIVLSPGEYWFNATPQCLNTLDGSCSVLRQFVSNSLGGNNYHGSWQALHEMFFNSAFFGFTYANWCDSSLGLNSTQCAGLSFGLRGAETP